MRLWRPQYHIDPYRVQWVYLVKDSKNAYSIWHKRWVKLFDASLQYMLQYGPRGVIQDQYNDLIEELYERLVAVKWPEEIKFTAEQEFFRDSPHGSFIMKVKNGFSFRGLNPGAIRIINDTDKNYIS